VACNIKCLNKRPLCFCCTTLRDVIFVKWYFTSVMSTTCILQHAVVCWVTTGTMFFCQGGNIPKKTPVTSQDVRLEIERIQKCALHSCIENLGNFCALNHSIKVTEVSLVSMGNELVIDISAMDFNMTFAKLLGFWEKLFEFSSNMNSRN
jgi:hypothetical protein